MIVPQAYRLGQKVSHSQDILREGSCLTGSTNRGTGRVLPQCPFMEPGSVRLRGPFVPPCSPCSLAVMLSRAFAKQMSVADYWNSNTHVGDGVGLR